MRRRRRRAGSGGGDTVGGGEADRGCGAVGGEAEAAGSGGGMGGEATRSEDWNWKLLARVGWLGGIRWRGMGWADVGLIFHL